MLTLIMTVALPANAANTAFNVTHPDYRQSPYALKDDDEQRFYVTGYTFNANGYYLYCWVNRADMGVSSYTATITNSDRSDNAEYRAYAAPFYYYFMDTSTDADFFLFNVTGVFCP